MNALIQLWEQRQSFWLDFIRRDLLTSGELKRMVQEEGLRGMTSNPTIFEKAISSGNDYDDQIKQLALKGKSSEEIFEELAVFDIQKAADILEPVYKSSEGTDGFVSLEVNPNLAYDTEETIVQAKRLARRVKRPNLMIKVPGTLEGIPAIENLVSSGLNINVTLLFSVDVYKQVLEAYLKGIEMRLKRGRSVKQIASVASFFVSRVDTIVDKYLDQMISEKGPNADEAINLLHKSAIANAKLAYSHYNQVVKSPRFLHMKSKGAQIQRLLWASTSTKDKRLQDVIYVNELIGPETVNTMPPQTVESFRDHGSVEPRLNQGLNQAISFLEALGKVGIDFDEAMAQLQKEGIKSFSVSYESLLRVVGAKRELLTGRIGENTSLYLGTNLNEYQNDLRRLTQEKWVERIWNKDPSIWKDEPEQQRVIVNSLGWLTIPGEMRRQISRIKSIVEDIKMSKFTHALLLGMGGSSLCPEVLRNTFGRKAGFPNLAILDSTEPASVWEKASRSRPEKTLFIVASKSGSTTEPNVFLSTFYDKVKSKKGSRAGENFIAITDPGTQMERIAKDRKFRHIVLNPPDIGGRYSALSFFGMLPAALMGIDINLLLSSAQEMAAACSPLVTADKNPGASLGVALGSMANAGRNKVTFFLSENITSFSSWIEQLIAESTGKEGKGIVPIETEPIEEPHVYRDDRIFVSIQTRSNKKLESRLKLLMKAGHPVIRVKLSNPIDIGGEFFRWEFATAVAGAVMGINAFDQPNVQESKDLTKKYLEVYKKEGRLIYGTPAAQENGVSIFASKLGPKDSSVESIIRSILSEIKDGDYVALLAYIARNSRNQNILQDIRESILKIKLVPTTIGFGPRFLHSTGQLHKGGANNGVFLQITADDKKDLPIPGEPYTYSVLKEAQALGDLNALVNKQRRVVRIHLKDVDRGLHELREIVRKIARN